MGGTKQDPQVLYSDQSNYTQYSNESTVMSCHASSLDVMKDRLHALFGIFSTHFNQVSQSSDLTSNLVCSAAVQQWEQARYIQSDSSRRDKKFSMILVKCPLYQVGGLFFLLVKVSVIQKLLKTLIYETSKLYRPVCLLACDLNS